MAASLIFLALTNAVVIFHFGRALRTPLIHITSWWYFWLYLSTFSISGLNIPSNETYTIYIVILISATAGSIFYYINNLMFIDLKIKSNIDNLIRLKSREVCGVNIIWRLVCYFVLPIVGYLFIKSIYILSTTSDINLYRDIVFATGETESVLFGSGTMQFLYGLTVGNFMFVGFFIGAANFVVNDDKKLLIASSLALCMDAIMMLGRFNFYIILITFVFIIIIKVMKKIDRNKFIYSTLGLVLLPMILIGYQRDSSDLTSQIKAFVLEYHTLGFSIFDGDRENKESTLNTIDSKGLASFGVLEQLTFVIIRKFDNSYQASSVLAGNDLNEKRIVGINNQIYNAYGTLAYSLYLDGGWLYIVIFPFAWGYALLRSISLAVRNKSIYHYSLVFLLTYIGMFGIFQSLLMGSFWLYLILISFIFKKWNLKLKQKFALLMRNSYSKKVI